MTKAWSGWWVVLRLLPLLWLAGCGGSGGGSDTAAVVEPPVTPPQVSISINIAAQPQPVAVQAGQSASFNVSATATPAGTALSYQWLRNGSEIAAAAAASFSTAALALSDDGARFSVRVQAGSVVLTSAEALLTVTAAPGGPTVPTVPAAAVPGQISTASNYALGLVNNGEVLAWGDGSFGGFGSGAAVAGSSARRVPVPASRHLSSGEVGALAVGQDGRVRGWGISSAGSLGAFNANITTPTELPGGITDATAALALDNYSLALRADGTVVHWPGTSSFSGSTFSVQPASVAGLSGVVKLVRKGVTLGSTALAGPLAIRSDGTVWALSFAVTTNASFVTTHQATATQVAGLSDITDISCALHCLALRSDGSVLAWGDNQQLQLGTGSTAFSTVAVAAVRELAGAKAVAALAQSSVAIGQDGRVWTWGDISHGQRTAGRLSLPTELRLSTGAAAVSASAAFVNLLLDDGSVWCWGRDGACNTLPNSSNQPERALGVQLMPSTVAITTQPAGSRVAAGQAATLSVLASGSGTLSYSWLRDGAIITGANGASLDSGALTLADEGSRWSVRVGDSSSSTVSKVVRLGVTPTPTSAERPARVVAGSLYGYRGAAGTTWAWGDGSAASSGDSVSKVWRIAGDYSASTAGSGFAVSVVAAPLALGGSHSCALLADRTVACWGRNHLGQLGDGSTADKSLPTAVPGLGPVQAVVAGQDFSCALRADASVACWGRNSSGQLGDGSLLDRLQPTPVPGLSDVVALGAGDFHVCALLRAGSVSCWGNNFFGAVGDGSSANNRSSPTAVAGLAGAVALGIGGGASCAIKADGTLWCWGSLGSASAAGFGAATASAVPGLTGVVAASVGAAHACVLRSDRRVLCWGDNGNGRLGDGTTAPRSIPTLVNGLLDAMAVSAGSAHSCAQRLDGGVQCWGATGDGAVGDGAAESLYLTQGPAVTAPRGIFGASDVNALQAGSRRACALLGSGGLVCWGNGSYGELGGGQPAATHYTPVPVRGGTQFWK